MKKPANDVESESQMNPYLMNLRKYGGRDEELEKARKQVLKDRKKLRKARDKTGERAEG